jgi:hypothetical protein
VLSPFGGKNPDDLVKRPLVGHCEEHSDEAIP